MRCALVLFVALIYSPLAYSAEPTIAANVQFKLPIKDSSGKITTADAVCLTNGTLLYFADGKFVFVTLGTPGPSPIVVPEPIITGKPMFGVVVEETSQRGALTGDQVKLLVDKEIPDYLHSVGGDWRVLDKDTTASLPDALKTFVAEAKGKQLPWLVLTNKEGKVVYSGKLLASKAEVMAILKK